MRLAQGAPAEVSARVRAARELAGDAALGRRAEALTSLAALLASELTPSAPQPAYERAPSDPVARRLVAAIGDRARRAALEADLAALGGRDVFARVLSRALAGARAKRSPPPDAIVVAAAGVSCRMPGEAPVELARRRPLARILARLATERLEHPGRALGWEAVLEAGWPGERVLPMAAAYRVRVAISTLRKLGLRDRLLTTPEGYVLDPRTPLVFDS